MKVSSNNNVIRLVDLLNSFNKLYKENSNGRCENYLSYIEKSFSDEQTLIQPIIFPAFLKELLNFTVLDYIPEKRNNKNKAPDFTPIDTFTHSFIFETKGTDSTKEELAIEFLNKSKFYLEEDPKLEFAIITNMRDLAVYSKQTHMFVENFSFSIQKLYEEWNQGISHNSKNTKIFQNFLYRFKRQDLTYDQKLERIINSPPHDETRSKSHKQILNEKILSSIKYIIDRLKSDISSQGLSHIEKLLVNDASRRRFIVTEINHILKEINTTQIDYVISNFESLKKKSGISPYLSAIDLYFYRVAYFALTRLILIRAWEDAYFIGNGQVTLYDGGLGVWYRHLNNNIEKVLDQAFLIGKKKYEWLFKEDTNYSWYRPKRETLINILYELAQYDLSELDRDILGTIYEEYLDRQDRKKKGQYYTPLKVVEFILDRAGFNNDDSFFILEDGKRKRRLIYDCASGSGGFLVECVRRIRDDSNYNENELGDLFQIRDAIIQGIYGSEISAFAYYISEVNILLQLTPIIKKILVINPEQQAYQGKFTLGLLHENSLKMHERLDEQLKEDSIDDYERTFNDIEYDIGRPESEKFSVFNFIKTHDDFDYCFANPPYIGENNNKELFRNTIRDIPYWKQYHQGKMDYLYWFIILAISKLKEGGKLGFITTSYWLTSSSGQKLRDYILKNVLIKEIIFFGQVKPFKNAQGQNSLIFILEKESDEEKRKSNGIKIVKALTENHKNSKKPTISAMIEHMQQYIDEDTYSDSLIEVFPSPRKQGDLDENAWFLFNDNIEDAVIDRMKKAGSQLDTLFDIHEGLITGCNKLDKNTLTKISSNDIQKYSLTVGMGVFVLNNQELELIELNKYESTLVKPFYKNSDIQRYWIDFNNCEYVFYLTKEINESKIPNLLYHLAGDNGTGKFRPILESRKETKKKNDHWFTLHRPREQFIFDEEKIVFPYRSPVSRFAYTAKSFYGASDMYFITNKNLKTIYYKSKNLNLKYLLGILNSSLFRFWFKHRSNIKDGKREIFGNRMGTFPVKEINFDDKIEVNYHNKIVILVNTLIIAYNELYSLQKYYNATIFDLEGKPIKPSLCHINSQEIIKSLPSDSIRKLKSSQLFHIDEVKDNFQIQTIDNLQPTLFSNTDLTFNLVIKGQKKSTSIKGNRQSLILLEEILRSYMKYEVKTVFEDILVPVNVEEYYKKKEEIINIHTELLYNTIIFNQKEINKIVCKLYGIKLSEII